MNARELARLTAACRIAIGAGFVLQPRRAMRPWLGPGEVARPAVRLLARAVGARDLVIGAGTLAAIDGNALPPWLIGGVVADATDFLVTLAEPEELPRAGRALVLAIAASGVALGGVALVGSGA